MMTHHDFRRIALGMEDAIEAAHMGHPDFRANGRIFATLHSDLKTGMVKLMPEQQQTFVREHAATFLPENGAWRRQGCTRVHLASVDEDTLGEAMTLAWQSAVQARAPRATRRSTSRRPAGKRPRPRGR